MSALPVTPQPDAGMARLARLVRLDRRKRLREALDGSREVRWAYCIGRVLAPSQGELLAYGYTEFDYRGGAEQARRHFNRLTRLAERWGKPEE